MIMAKKSPLTMLLESAAQITDPIKRIGLLMQTTQSVTTESAQLILDLVWSDIQALEDPEDRVSMFAQLEGHQNRITQATIRQKSK